MQNIKITKYDRDGLQITKGFWLERTTKISKIGLQRAMELQSLTSSGYKFQWNYKAQQLRSDTVSNFWSKQYFPFI